jgi:hypothetical protein
MYYRILQKANKAQRLHRLVENTLLQRLCAKGKDCKRAVNQRCTMAQMLKAPNY